MRVETVKFSNLSKNFQDPESHHPGEKYPNVMMDQPKRSTSFFEILGSKGFGSLLNLSAICVTSAKARQKIGTACQFLSLFGE